jgi:hypothetical protein
MARPAPVHFDDQDVQRGAAFIVSMLVGPQSPRQI